MSGWSKDELRSFMESDDLHISPLRDDGVSYGTSTWIWSVVVDGALYVRAYSGKDSRWYQAALKRRAGRIKAAGLDREVTFEPMQGGLGERIDDAYRTRYRGSPYLDPMISHPARSATIRISPQASEEK